MDLCPVISALRAYRIRPATQNIQEVLPKSIQVSTIPESQPLKKQFSQLLRL